MKKNIIAFVLSFIMMVGTGADIVQASNVHMTDQTLETEKNEKSAKSARAEIVGWRYKTVNGVLYRRLFNYTHNEWVGNWEKV